jgi:hypothetical protein
VDGAVPTTDWMPVFAVVAIAEAITREAGMEPMEVLTMEVLTMEVLTTAKGPCCFGPS